MATLEAQKEKKSRFGRLLGSKRDKSPESPPTFPPDSAYASETPITDKSTPDIVPAEKNSDIANIDKDRNLGLKPSTGEVLDRDTGEVVTVVTTTTTTTTTTTRKPGKKPDVHEDVQKDVQETTQSQPAFNGTATNESVADRSGVAEMPATPTGTSGLGAKPLPAPVATAPELMADQTSSSRLRKLSPGIPPRSNRRSGDRSSFVPTVSDTTPDTGYFARPGPTGNTPPVSPTRASNFSYPARNRNSMDPDGVSLATTDTHNKSTIGDLRAAAKGIHGVGETLRGTLNNTIDQNFPRKNDKKAARANAKNEAVLNRGRQEVAGIPSRGGSQYQQPDVSPIQTTPGGHTYPVQHHLPPPPSGIPNSAGAPPGRPPIPQGLQNAPPVKPPSPQRTATAEQTVPGSWSPDYDEAGGPDGGTYSVSATGGLSGKENGSGREREREKSKSISKLFKRKPVTAKEGELRVTNP